MQYFNNYDVLDIIRPVIIGASSYHTVGAV